MSAPEKTLPSLATVYRSRVEGAFGVDTGEEPLPLLVDRITA